MAEIEKEKTTKKTKDFDNMQQKIKQTDDQSDTKLVQQIKRKKYTDGNETEQYSHIANNTFQMRLRVLNMETNVLKTYSTKQLIDNEKDTWTNIQKIETCIGIADTALKNNNFYKAENELRTAENLSTLLMRKIKSVLWLKAAKQKILQTPKRNIEVPDYRSIVTVRGSQEDVRLCIQKATDAFESGKYDKAESLLMKAERISPTKNAKDLLKQVQNAKKLKQKPELIEKAKSSGHLYTIKNEELKSKTENVRASKCQTAFEKAFPDNKYVKSEQLLHKGARLNPILNVEENKSGAKLTIANNIMKENSKKKIEEPNSKCKTEEEYLNETTKTYYADDSTRVQRISSDTKTFYPSWDSESHLLKRSSIIPSRNSIEEKSKIRNSVQPAINKAFEGQLYSLEKNKNNTVMGAKNDSDRDNSSKGGKQEPSNKNKLLCGSNPEYTNDVGNFKRKTSEQNQYYSKHNSEFKTINPLPKNQADTEKLDNPINFPNTEEKFKPTPLIKDRLEMVKDNRLSRERNMYSNCYEFPVQSNESNKTEAIQCMRKAEDAFKKGEYDRAEHLLLKSLRIYETQNAKLNLQLVRDAKAQNNTNVIVKTDIKHNKHFNQHSQNEQVNEYYQCMKLMSQARDNGNLATAVHYLQKAIRIKPNDADKEQLKIFQALKKENDERLKQEEQTEILKNLAIGAKNDKKFGIALYYIQVALKRKRNEKTDKELRNLIKETENRKVKNSSTDIKFEANKLLNIVSECIKVKDIEKAEFFMIISWDMSKVKRTIIVYKQFLQARINVYSEGQKNEFTEKDFNNIFESDKLVKLALEKDEKKQIEEIEELLKEASKLHPSILINKLLVEISPKKTKARGTRCSIM